MDKMEQGVEIPAVEMQESVGTKDASASTASAKSEKGKKKPLPRATIAETLSFVFGSGTSTIVIWIVGTVGAIGNGAVYPILAYLFSNAFSDISGAASEGLAQVRTLAFTFMIVGVYGLIMATIQTSCFEVVAFRASQNLRLQWFHALLRQDPAYFDVNDIGGIATNVGPSANRYRRGLGRKFGEGIQFFTTGVGGKKCCRFDGVPMFGVVVMGS
jgi:ATP-binding cassette subfamily B (MDR/TAP) protein 1